MRSRRRIYFGCLVIQCSRCLGRQVTWLAFYPRIGERGRQSSPCIAMQISAALHMLTLAILSGSQLREIILFAIASTPR